MSSPSPTPSQSHSQGVSGNPAPAERASSWMSHCFRTFKYDILFVDLCVC